MKKQLVILIITIFLLIVPENAFALKIVIDPGHGGSDPGAISASGMQEKTVNLDIALKVRDNLVDKGNEVIMTRTDDTFMSLKDRVNFTKKADADLFISIHANAFPNMSMKGTLVLYFDSAYPQRSYPASKEMTALSKYSKQFATKVLNAALLETNTYNRGLLQSAVYVTRMGYIPSVLIETAFLTNKEDSRLLADESFRVKMAAGIANGVSAFVPPSFIDISNHWGRNFIMTMKEKGMLEDLQGSNNFFSPDQPITRAEFMSVMDKLFPFAPRLSAISPPSGAEGSDNLSDPVEGQIITKNVDNGSEDTSSETAGAGAVKSATGIPSDVVQSEVVTSNEAGQTGSEENSTPAASPDPASPYTPADSENPENGTSFTNNFVFSDLSRSYWAYHTIENAVTLGYIAGYPDGTIRADQPISRAEVAVIFNKIWGPQPVQTASEFKGFTDVPADSWYADDVNILKSAAIIKGITEVTFRPDRLMTRAEMAAMVVSFMKTHPINKAE